MKSLYKTQDLVEEILTKYPETRNSDNLLFVKVCEEIGYKIGHNINGFPFAYVLQHMKEYGIPPYETVRRSRQKIQHDNPELSANDTVEGFRMIKEEQFKEFSRRF